MTKEKYTFRKQDMVKRTKSAPLAAILEKAGWVRETSGGIVLPRTAEIEAVNDKKPKGKKHDKE